MARWMLYDVQLVQIIAACVQFFISLKTNTDGALCKMCTLFIPNLTRACALFFWSFPLHPNLFEIFIYACVSLGVHILHILHKALSNKDFRRFIFCTSGIKICTSCTGWYFSYFAVDFIGILVKYAQIIKLGLDLASGCKGAFYKGL